MDIFIRPYQPGDLSRLYQICLETADNGGDATSLYPDRNLPGDCFAAPYAHFEPDSCFVIDSGGLAVGYIVGTRNSDAFYERCNQEWLPRLRSFYPLSKSEQHPREAWMIDLIHSGFFPDPGTEDYPAHLHINLLPTAQGQGWGRKLIEVFIEKLKTNSIPGVHLGVDKKNVGAIQFYERVGFTRVCEFPWSILYGMRL